MYRIHKRGLGQAPVVEWETPGAGTAREGWKNRGSGTRGGLAGRVAMPDPGGHEGGWAGTEKREGSGHAQKIRVVRRSPTMWS